MNQVLKDVVYGKGTSTQIRFIADIGGMNEEEYKVFDLIHQGKSELYIQEEMSLDRKAYSRIEEAVRAKALLAVFECINCRMEKKGYL